MVYVNSRRCEVADCYKNALWWENDHSRKRVCHEHRQKGVAYSQMAPVCAEQSCYEEPCFGMTSTGKPVYCAKHKMEGMTEVRARSCGVPGCGKIPSYGVDGKREVCRDHRTKGMSYAILTCESPNCNKNPSFAPRGETRRRFCKRHAEPHMVNVYYKYCDVPQCPERASFESGGKLRCLQHIEPGMRPRNNICQVAGGGCTRQSSYGPEGGKPVVCTVHKQPGMVQVRTKTCKQPGCEKIPSYGFPCMSREYCKPHALEGMVYSAGSRCRFRGCRAEGIFNFPGVRGGSFCKKHRENGMVDIQPRQCQETGCKYAASFGDRHEKKIRFCARHKLLGMISIQEMWPLGRATSEISSIEDGSFEDGSSRDQLAASVMPVTSIPHEETPLPGTISPCPGVNQDTIIDHNPDAAAEVSANHVHRRTSDIMGSVDKPWANPWPVPADADCPGTSVSMAIADIYTSTFPVTVPDISPPVHSMASAFPGPTSSATVPVVTSMDMIPSTYSLGDSSASILGDLECGTRTIPVTSEVFDSATFPVARDLFGQDLTRGCSRGEVHSLDGRLRDARNSKRARKGLPTNASKPTTALGNATGAEICDSMEPVTGLTALASYNRSSPSQSQPAASAFKSGLAALSVRQPSPNQTWEWLAACTTGATDSKATRSAANAFGLRPQQFMPLRKVPHRSSRDPVLTGDLEHLADAAASYAPGTRAISRPGTGNEQPLATSAFLGGDRSAISSGAPLVDVDFATSTAFGPGGDSGVQSMCGPSASRLSHEVEEDHMSPVDEQSFLSSLLGVMDPTDPRGARLKGAMVSRLKSISRASS